MNLLAEGVEVGLFWLHALNTAAAVSSSGIPERYPRALATRLFKPDNRAQLLAVMEVHFWIPRRSAVECTAGARADSGAYSP